jgi:hypothetical protein
MGDELNLDRVIDVPVYQDVLTWDALELGFLNRCLRLFLPDQSDTFLVSALMKGCGLLAVG